MRCSYCDFNTYAGLEGLIPTYARALATEIRVVGQALRPERGRAQTIFFGGGTPSLTPLAELARLFSALHDAFELTPDCEITLEANPGTVDQAYLDGLRALGVNRISFGVQSAQASELKLYDRRHTFEQAVEAVRMARAAGFDRHSHGINIDLIFGIPHQTLAMWRETLNRTLALQPDHLSCYALSLEHGTPLRAWVYRGLLPMPDPDLAADMYTWASETLEAHGFMQYEISNWAKNKEEARSAKAEERSVKEEGCGETLPSSSLLLPKFACRHNLTYWRNEPYLGFGAGAHGCAGGWRYANVLAPAAYISRMKTGSQRAFPFSPALAQATPVTPEEAMGETMMLGMRLVAEGVTRDDFERRFGIGLEAKYGRELRRLKALKLVEWDGQRARLTKQGRLLGNRVFREFV